MRIAVLGTGSVGRTLSGRFAELGHDVTVGTRDVTATLGREDWTAPPDTALAAFAELPDDVELFVDATSGAGAVDALRAVGERRLSGRVVLDVSNPLDFSGGFPPTLSIANDDSLGELIQRTFPDVRVVKALNTVTASVMVNPSSLAGAHVLPLCGDDAEAKSVVGALLRELGWPADALLDLGGIRAARSMEMYLPLWLSLMQALGTAEFNIGVVTGREGPSS